MGTVQAFCCKDVWPPGRLDELFVRLTCQQETQHQAEEHASTLHLTQHRQKLAGEETCFRLGPHNWVPRMRNTSWNGDWKL